MRHLTLFTTGGTIEKTYNEAAGVLENSRSIVQTMLDTLRLVDTTVEIVPLLAKDSLHITDAERTAIVQAVLARADAPNAADSRAFIILHGTDTLPLTGEALLARLPRPPLPIVLTGAMRPFELIFSDAVQNLTEAILATRLLSPGVYFVGHGLVLPFPGVIKDRARGTFSRS